jgi:hypothetical protein
MNNAIDTDVQDDGYETPELSEYGSIEEWTKGSFAQIIDLSAEIL